MKEPEKIAEGAAQWLHEEGINIKEADKFERDVEQIEEERHTIYPVGPFVRKK